MEQIRVLLFSALSCGLHTLLLTRSACHSRDTPNGEGGGFTRNPRYNFLSHRIVGIVDRELIRVSGFQDVVHKVGEDSITLLLQIVHIEFLQVVAKRCLTGYLLQKPSDRVYRLVHCSHPHQSLEQVGLGERSLDWDGQVLIQCCDRTSTTFFRFQCCVA